MAVAKEHDQATTYDSPGASNGLSRNSADVMTAAVAAATTHSLTDRAQSDSTAKHAHRVKRHGAHGHHHGTTVELDSFVDTNPNTKKSIENIFRHYGNSDAETMNIIEFERMIKELGLTRLIAQKQIDDGHPEHGPDDSSDHDQNRNGKVCMRHLP